MMTELMGRVLLGPGSRTLDAEIAVAIGMEPVETFDNAPRLFKTPAPGGLYHIDPPPPFTTSVGAAISLIKEDSHISINYRDGKWSVGKGGLRLLGYDLFNLPLPICYVALGEYRCP